MSWTRFWVPRDGSLHLDPDDYLADPEGEHGNFRNPSAQTLEALAKRPCLALLGEPGIGKSRTLRAYLDRLRDPWSQDGDLLSFNLTDGYNLEQEIGGAPEFQRWLCGQTTLHLFLDSLDEHHDGGAAKVAAWLLRKLDRGPVLRLRLRLACRTADWPRALDERLSGYWKGKDDLGFYELAPLRRKDVELAAGPDASSFLQEVERRHAVALAIKPITLRFLLDEFQRNRALPAQRWELYQRGCRLLCSEESRSRHDMHQTGKLDAEKRLAVAARIAAVTMFCHRPLIWHGRGDTPSDAVREREICGGSEQAPTGEVNVSAGEVAEVLAGTGLFTARADKGLGWAHQTYAEFLTAWFLKNRGLSVDEMLQAVTNPGTSGKVVPELHEVAAWLAGMSPEFFAALAHSDPEVLLRSDFAKVGEADREMLVGILLEKLDKKETLDDRLWERRTSRRLEHPKLATQLRPYIVDREKYFMARRAAITIAESCTTAELQDDLATVALDAEDDPHLRARAAHAVVRIGDRATKQRLRSLAFEQCGPDPQDDLKGYAMEALWREDLTTEEVFANLLAPKQPNYYGAYQTFVSHHLPMRLRSSDLPRALNWTATLPAQHTDTSVHTFNTVMEDILKRAWGQLDEPAILSTFAVAARARLTCHESIFGGHHGNNTSDAEFLADDEKRRALLRSLLDLPPLNHEATTLVFYGHLVVPRDVPWVIDQMTTAVLTSARSRWAEILVRLLFHHWTLDILEATVAAWEISSELREALRSFLHDGSVEIDSPLAADLRNTQLEEEARTREYEKLLSQGNRRRREIPPAAEHIADCLRRFEAGDVDAGWELHRWMTVDPEGKAHGDELEPDLTRLPGWKHADEQTRDRIANAGRAYLLIGNAEPGKWLSENVVYWPAAAGCRYLHLLAKLDQHWVNALRRDTWSRWAAVLLDFSQEGAEALRRQLIAKAYHADPSSVLESLRVILQKDNTTYGHPLVLRRMADCWDERLGHVLLDFARSFDLKVRFWGELLDELLDHSIEGTEEYAVTFLLPPIAPAGPKRERAHTSAHALIAHARDFGWSVVWPIIREDPAFGREVFLKVVFSLPIRGNHTWGDALSEGEAADLCLWLEEQFPRHEDPKSTRSGRFTAVTARQRVGELRNAVVNNIVMRGTRAAVGAIERLSKAMPNRDWTVDLVRARRAMVQGTWTPRAPEEVLALRPRLPVTEAAAHIPPGDALSSPQAMDRNEILEALGALPPPQFEDIVFKLGIPPALLSGQQAPQLTRAIEVVRYLESSTRLQAIVPLLRASVAPSSAAVSSSAAAAPAPPPTAWPAAPMYSPRIEKVDFGVITIREDELAAVLQRFPDKLRTVSGHRRYRIRRVRLSPTEAYTVAVLRCPDQGNGEAQAAARDLLEDLAPSWILVVGIGGGVPASEFSLGDVVVSTRIADFSVEAVLKDQSREYAFAGGPLHPEVSKWVADIRSMVEDRELDGWNDEGAIGRRLPPVEITDDNFYGDDTWRKDVRAKIERRFSVGQTRPPLVTTGVIASSDRLIKDADILQVWLKFARQIQAVEMESAGVYRAAHSRQIPFLAIRGISDVVGFKRHPDWTDYACHSAAAFTLVFLQALMRARAIEPRDGAGADRAADDTPDDTA